MVKNAKTTTPETAPAPTAPVPATPAPVTPAPAAPAGTPPATTETAQTETAKEEKKLAVATFTAMAIDALTHFLKGAVKLATNIKDAQTKEKAERKTNAKGIADLKRRYAVGKDGGTIPLDWTFPIYFEKVVGGKCPGRMLSLAGLFNSLCMLNGPDGKPMLAEAIYDSAALDWLEKANAIVNAAQKAHGENWKTCADVCETLAILNSPGDAAEKLDAIRARQKGETAEGETDGAVAMTAEMAVEFLIGHYQQQAKLMAAKPENAKELFCLARALAERVEVMEDERTKFILAVENTFDTATIQGWLKADDAGVAPHIEIISAHPNTAPAETPAPVTAEPAAA